MKRKKPTEVTKADAPPQLVPHLWKPGQSGNPGGMPKGMAEVKMLARSMSAEALEKMYELMRTSSDDRVQLAAAKEIMDRGLGKPREEESQAPIMIRDKAELVTRMETALARLKNEGNE